MPLGAIRPLPFDTEVTMKVNTLWLTIYTAIAVLGLYIAGTTLARAQEIEVGQGIVCDSAQQVTRFLEIGGEPQAALDKVNAEANDPVACVLLGVAFVRGEQTTTVRNQDGAWRVTQILVMAVYLPTGWQSIAPHVYYSALRVEERGA